MAPTIRTVPTTTTDDGAAVPRRVGLLVPSSNTVMEPDFVRGLPADAALHTGRMLLDDVTPASEARMLDEATLPAARALGTAGRT